MNRALLKDPKFYALLLLIDQELALQAREARCPVCGNRLDSARFPRKPRGLPPSVEADPDQKKRLSLCCDVCGKRVTPPSVRFFGRRVYFAPCFLTISALRGKPTARRLAKLHERYGVDRRTVRRWRRWWHDVFPTTAFWRVQRGLVLPPADETVLPSSLLDRFSGTDSSALTAALRFLSPLTTASIAVG